MCDQSIRVMTAEERRDAHEVWADARYDELVALVEDEQRDEYEAEFGAEYREKHPFKPYLVHERVMERLKAETVDL